MYKCRSLSIILVQTKLLSVICGCWGVRWTISTRGTTQWGRQASYGSGHGMPVHWGGGGTIQGTLQYYSNIYQMQKTWVSGYLLSCFFIFSRSDASCALVSSVFSICSRAQAVHELFSFLYNYKAYSMLWYIKENNSFCMSLVQINSPIICCSGTIIQQSAGE